MNTGGLDVKKCSYCGYFHDLRCPFVKSYEYHPDGSLKRVEFFEFPIEIGMHEHASQTNLAKINLGHS